VNTLERAVHQRWERNAVQRYIGTCDVCVRNRIRVCRQPRRHKRECLDCYVARTEP
jgi:hypothetical protein